MDSCRNKKDKKGIGMTTVDVQRKCIIIIFATALVSGCAHKNILTIHEMSHAFLLPIKFHRQETDKCGIAALSSVLEYLGVPYSGIETIYSKSDGGTKLITLVNYANKYVDTDIQRVGYGEILGHMLKRRPMIVMRKLGQGYHYYVVKGFVMNDRKIVVNDGYEENVLLSVTENGASKDADIGIIFGKETQL